MAISDLSRLRERWARLENQIAKLDRQILDADPGEKVLLTEKRRQVENRLAQTKVLVGWEERRLLNPNAKLIFRLKESRNKQPVLEKDLI